MFFYLMCSKQKENASKANLFLKVKQTTEKARSQITGTVLET